MPAMNRSSTGLRLFVLLQALLVGACVSTVIPHEPTANMTREEARSVLRQTFEEQPEKYRPVAIEIGDDAIRLAVWTTKHNAWTGVVTTVEVRETYYFSNLANLQLVKRGGRLLIKLSNRAGSVQRWVEFYSQKQGTDFLDAMNSMAQSD